MNLIEITPPQSMIFEDNKVIVALAFQPNTKGHCVVIWKSGAEDLNKLPTEDYEYLMDVVDVTRNTLRTFYKVDKVYLMYLDETNWVHWHLIPRYEEKVFNILRHSPETITDFSDAVELSKIFNDQAKKMIVESVK